MFVVKLSSAELPILYAMTIAQQPHTRSLIFKTSGYMTNNFHVNSEFIFSDRDHYHKLAFSNLQYSFVYHGSSPHIHSNFDQHLPILPYF